MNFSIDVNIRGLDELSKAVTTIAVVLAACKSKGCDCEESSSKSEDVTPEESGNYREVVEEPDKSEQQEQAEEPAPAEETVRVSPVAKPEEQTKVDTPAKTYDDVTNKAIELLDGGKQDALISLLSKYGVMAIPDLPADKLDSFYNDLEAL